MPRTRPDQTVILLAAILAGASYLLASALPLSQVASTTWKGAGVALLALYASQRARDIDGWLLVAVMAFGALGDMLIELRGLVAGAIAFLIGHLFAIALYLRNRRPSPSLSQRLLAAVLVPATGAMAPGVALYALGLSLMAATAWLSRFPRYRVGLGAVLFVISDLLIFARAGPLSEAPWIGAAIWTLYFTGQVLVCLGVSGAMRQRRA